MTEQADAAAAYARRGWAVFPLHNPIDGACSCGKTACSSPAKHPRISNGLNGATDDADTVKAWWKRWPHANIGLITGVAFDVLDIDGEEGKASFAALEGEVPGGPQTVTGGGGNHLLFQATGINNKAGWRPKLDWRGVGGYIVAPPSLHISGITYEWHVGPDEPLQAVPEWLRLILQPPRVPKPTKGGTLSFLPPLQGQGTPYGLRALDSEIDELAHAAEGTRNHTLNNCAYNLYQLVASNQLEERLVDDRIFATAASIGLPEYEIRDTMASGKKAGLATPRAIPAPIVTAQAIPIPKPKPVPQPDGSDATEDEAKPPTGWERVDLSPWLDGDPPDDTPKLCARLDGQMILYPGKVHSFNGEPECGKSWVAQFACAQVLGNGGSVTYLDFEDAAGTVTARMLALGCEIDAIRYRFHYHRLDQPFSFDAAEVLDAALAEAEPTLTILDGVTEAMNLCALNPYDNSDVAKFWAMIPRRLARTGSAAVLIDHVVKDNESRGRWAIGAQHKMAAVDGASFTIETVTPFGRGKAGISRLIITKDRIGHLRQHAIGNMLAEFRLTSAPDETMTAELRQPSGHGDTFRPTTLMERLSRYVEEHAGMSRRGILAAVKGDDKVLGLGLELLAGEGFIRIVQQGQSKLHEHIKPFRADEDENPPTDTAEHEDI